MAECKKCGTEIAEGLDFCNTCKSSPKKKKSMLKIVIPVVAVVLVVAIVVGAVFLIGNKKEEKPNLAVYLQGTQLKYSYLDKINPVVIQDGYDSDSATFIENGIYFKDSYTLAYPLTKDQIKKGNYFGNPSHRGYNIKEGTYTVEYAQTERLEKFYSKDGRFVYYTDIHPVNYNEKQKYLQGYDLNKKEIIFTISPVESLLGVKKDTGEIFYLKTSGSGKKELFKTTDGKTETRVDYNIINFKAFYSTGEGYFNKEDGLYYFNGESSKKLMISDYSNATFATHASVGAVSTGNKLNVIVKDRVSSVDCVKSAESIAITTNGSTIYYLDNVKSDAIIIGRKMSSYSSNTTDIYTGDLYKLSIADSKVGTPVLYDTDVQQGSVTLRKDGITYYKNLISISSVVDLEFSYYSTGDFYVNKKLVAEDASYVEYKSCNEIYYITDVPNLKNIEAVVVDNEKASGDIGKLISEAWDVFNELSAPGGFTAGTLKKYDGTQSVVIAEDVHDYYIKDNGQILMLTKYNEENCCSELYYYGENGNVFIDYDVSDIIRIG